MTRVLHTARNSNVEVVVVNDNEIMFYLGKTLNGLSASINNYNDDDDFDDSDDDKEDDYVKTEIYDYLRSLSSKHKRLFQV